MKRPLFWLFTPGAELRKPGVCSKDFGTPLGVPKDIFQNLAFEKSPISTHQDEEMASSILSSNARDISAKKIILPLKASMVQTPDLTLLSIEKEGTEKTDFGNLIGPSASSYDPQTARYRASKKKTRRTLATTQYNNLRRPRTEQDTVRSGQLNGRKTKFCEIQPPITRENNFKTAYTSKPWLQAPYPV